MRVRAAVVLTALLVVMAASAGAQLSPDLAAWADGPEGFLLTKKEQKEWQAITTDAAARHFVELFWARRDPSPQTPVNEFKASFELRVQHADREFACEGHRGALTDRGRVLILMGTPRQAEKRAPTHTVERMDDLEYGSDEVRANAELWMYDPALLPAGFKVKGTRLLFVFYERKAGTNDFTLDRSHPDATLALRALGDAPDVWLLHPGLTEAPKPVAVFGAQAADAAHLAWLDAAAAPWSEKASLELELGVADATSRPLWAQLSLPAEAPALTELAGRVLHPDGAIAATFQVAAKPVEAGSARVYHLTFPLAVGSYTVEVAGAAAGQVQAVRSAQVELSQIPAEGPWLSPTWVGLPPTREEGAARGIAYTFEGWHLVPRTALEAKASDELSYFGYAVRPGVSPSGSPALTARVSLARDGKRIGQPFSAPLRTAELGGGLHLYASSLSLAALTEAGTYTLELEVKDTVLGTKVERTITVTLVD